MSDQVLMVVTGNPPDVHCELDEMKTIQAPKWKLDSHCHTCDRWFGLLSSRRHHCRNCGNSFCGKHCIKRLVLCHFKYIAPERVCDDCFEAYLKASINYPKYLQAKTESIIFETETRNDREEDEVGIAK